MGGFYSVEKEPDTFHPKDFAIAILCAQTHRGVDILMLSD